MKTARRVHLNRDKTRAQGMVEFALILPILLLLLVGIIEFGYFFFIYNMVNTATREAVRYGAAAGNSAVGVPYYQDCDGIREVAKRIGAYAGIADGDIDIGYDDGPDDAVDWGGSYTACPATNVLGGRIVIRVMVNYQPIIAHLGFPPIPIEVGSARTIVEEVEVVGTLEASPTVQYTRTPTATIVIPDTLTPTVTATLCQTPEELGGCE